MSDSFNSFAATGALCDECRIDHAYVDGAVRLDMFKLLALDMDSTLITIECIDELADFAGKRTTVEKLTAAAMHGNMEFEASLKSRVAQLQGVPEIALQRVFDERVRLSPGAEELLLQFRTVGAHTVLLSGGFTFFADKVRRTLSIDEAYANTLEIIEGQITGRLVPPLVGPRFKAQTVRDLQIKMGFTPQETIVVGDGANDIPMMNCASYSVAYHAKEITNVAARWSVKYGGLDVILDFIGAASH